MLLDDANYSTRPTRTPEIADAELNELIERSRVTLYALMQSLPDATPFNPNDAADIYKQINTLKEQIESLPQDSTLRVLSVKKLKVMLDLHKINQLKEIIIPQQAADPLNYCTLSEITEGVTEKVALISLARVKQQLGQLLAQESLTIASYDHNRKYFKLTTDAIIKLPKRGNIKEVQREAIALSCSRLLGLNTTASTMISYQGHPALFVPFNTIRLLSDFATGKTMDADLGLTGKTYTHYATINPVGEGIQADRFVEDFGHALALFYLCSDADAIGGYCQNKALTDSKNLFIFDQVLMGTRKFALESRLCLKPDQLLIKHTRHGSGRNRTLIEDSSMITKFASIMQLKAMGEQIVQYLNAIVIQHSGSDPSPDQKTLRSDAKKLREKIQERIREIDAVLPQTSGIISPDEIRQVLILEKLLHNPVLFTDDGRPYKNPWTSKHDNPVELIEDLNNGSVHLHFKSKISAKMVAFIKYHGGGESMLITDPRILMLSKSHLNALSEGMLHPENNLHFEPTADYLNSDDLEMIKNAYSEGYRTDIIHTINKYRAAMNDATSRSKDKLLRISNTETELRTFIERAKDKGFGMHILKKFYFDAQQQLQRLMNPAFIPTYLNQAFEAALNLDRMAEFNAVVHEAVAQNKLNDALFHEFLLTCIQKEFSATNHTEAKSESLALSLEIAQVLHQLKSPPIPLLVQLGGRADSADEFDIPDHPPLFPSCAILEKERTQECDQHLHFEGQ